CQEISKTIFTASMSSPSKRREMDVMKLMMSDYNVEMLNNGLGEFNVELHGPQGSMASLYLLCNYPFIVNPLAFSGLYEGGVWKVHVELPDSYPYKSPSIGFVNKILHPNIDELSGGVCLDVINESWSPMFAYCDRYAKEENTTTAAVEEESGTDISDGECTE
ncbi:hypothetical protein RJ639_034645, partial [Escallonia herrerae]